jgi:tRNA pseudouridine38-40 synthase
MLGANTLLPDAISILWVQPVSADFHARYSATRRTYHYLILNRASRPGLMRDRVTWECRPLAEARMMAAAQPLLGEHDFAAYRAVACQARTSIRTVYRLDIRRSGAWLVIEVEANAFLHHMVRNIAGVLMEIGRGRQPVEWAAEVLHSRDRTRGGVTAPAGGLYLAGVHYPEQYGLP